MSIKQLERKIETERAWLRLYAAQGNLVAVQESERRLADLMRQVGRRGR